MNINNCSGQNFGANIGGYYKKLYDTLPQKTVSSFTSEVEKCFPGTDFNLFLGDVYKNAVTLKNMARVWVCKYGVIMQKDFEVLGKSPEAVLDTYKTAIKELSQNAKATKFQWWNA